MILALALVAIILVTRHHPLATAQAVDVRFVSYTNPPGNNLRFALFSVSNQASYSVRWRGDWVEVEGSPYRKARTVNPKLPGYQYEPVLRAGEVLNFAVGEPLFDSEPARWRLCLSFSRYTPSERWLDFSFKHKVPFLLRRIVRVDSQQILSSSNHVTASSAWLEVK